MIEITINGIRCIRRNRRAMSGVAKVLQFYVQKSNVRISLDTKASSQRSQQKKFTLRFSRRSAAVPGIRVKLSLCSSTLFNRPSTSLILPLSPPLSMASIQQELTDRLVVAVDEQDVLFVLYRMNEMKKAECLVQGIQGKRESPSTRLFSADYAEIDDE